MAGYVVCGCCGRHVPATAADVGQAVVCPLSRQLVMVTAANLHVTTTPPEGPRRNDRPTVLVLVPLLLVGGLGLYLWNPFSARKDDARSTETARDPRTPPTVVAEPAARPGGLVVAPSPRAVTRPGGSAAAVVVPSSGPRDGAGGVPTTPPPPDPHPGRTAAAVPAPAPPTAVVMPPPRPVPAGETAVVTPPGVGGPPASGAGAIVPGESAVAPPSGDAVRNDPQPNTDARGLTVHRLTRRIDHRTAEQLERELLGVREVALDLTVGRETSSLLVRLGDARRAAGFPYPGSAVVARNRPDLAGLPYRLGPDASLSKADAEAMDALSRQLRARIRASVPGDDPRPDPDALMAALLRPGGGLFRDGKWATAEAVPCVQQMLQPMGKDVRRMAIELLRTLTVPGATDALVSWAVFDLDAGNRAAAVDALRARDQGRVNAQLLSLLRYPWPRAAEHAAEALVELRATDAVPELAARLALPDPDAPQAVPLAGSAGGFRRELVRVNHLRNCLLCHPPAGGTTDLVRGLVPDVTRPPPPAYYEGHGQFVSAAATYLKQDFSCELPVPAPGVWPAYQRSDFLVLVRPVKPGEVTGDPAYRAAVLFALRELTGQNPGDDAAAWAGRLGGRAAPDDRLLGFVFRYLALSNNPDPLLALALREFGGSFLRLTPAEQAVVITGLRGVYGGRATWYALVGYLDWVARSGDPSLRGPAGTLLAEYLRAADPDGAGGVIDPAAAVGLLANANPHLRAAAARALGSLGVRAKDRYRDLVKLLKDPDPDVREAAAVALGDLTVVPDDGHDALALATRDAAGRVRVAAAAALGKLKYSPRSAARPLAEGLVTRQTWDAPELRPEFEKLAAAAFTGMKGRTAGGYATVVGAAVGDTPTDLAPAALAKLLEAIGPPPDASPLQALVGLLARPEFKAVAEAHLLAVGDAAVAPLIAGLRAESPRARAAVATLLGKAAAVNRSPGATRASWRAALDALATVKAADLSADVRSAAAAAITELSKGQ